MDGTLIDVIQVLAGAIGGGLAAASGAVAVDRRRRRGADAGEVDLAEEKRRWAEEEATKRQEREQMLREQAEMVRTQLELSLAPIRECLQKNTEALLTVAQRLTPPQSSTSGAESPARSPTP